MFLSIPIFSIYYFHLSSNFSGFTQNYRQRFARRTRCGLATEIFPLAQDENSKKSSQLIENLAMKFCALL